MGVIENMQKEMDQMKAEIIDLRSKMGLMTVDDVGEYVVSPKKVTSQQEIRDEIIQKAKDDIEDLKTKTTAGTGEKCYATKGFPYAYEVKFVVNKEKRTVVALLHIVDSIKEVKYKGITKCLPTDCFNSSIGKSIALHRALGLNVPEEYYHTPQPTEVRVGDIVSWGYGNDYLVLRKEGTGYDFKCLTSKQTFYNTHYLDENIVHRIIDDSREN